MEDITLRRIDFLDGSNFIYQNKIPSHMMYLRDEMEYPQQGHTAWQKLKEANQAAKLIFSDVYRSPASSEAAYLRKNGIQRPGYSGHNYGISVDLAVDETIKASGFKTYADLIVHMEKFGWTPYQGVKSDLGDYKRGSEDWHFNFIGEHAKDPNDSNHYLSGSAQVENWINSNFTFESEISEIQQMLKDLKFYQGNCDGVIGPISKSAISKFIAAWVPTKPGKPAHIGIDDVFIRTINIVHCNIRDEKGNPV